MDAVLGLSMTPTTVGLVLVEGQDADGATMDKDEFAVHDRGLVSAVNTSEKAAAAVMRTEAIAAARGHRLHSIGVTWSEDADTEASLLLESLSESGFDNIVAVRLPEATEALARGIARVIGYEITAVCVIEPDEVVVLVVDMADGAVQTAVNHTVNTDEDLARWLSAIFAQAEWQPEALVLVGSASDLEAITPHLEDVLAVPVFVPAEAQLALARGAAIASTHGPDYFFDREGTHSGRMPTGPQQSVLPRFGAAGVMLGVGVVTFVVSGSLAIGLQLTSGSSAKPAEKPPAASTSEASTAEKAVQQEPAAPPSVEAALPAPPPPAEPSPPPVYGVEPVPIADPVQPEAPAPDALTPVDGSVPEGAIAANGGVPLPPGITDPAPGLVPAPVTPVPEQKPGILRRLKEKIAGIGEPDVPAQAPVEVAPPPQDAPLVPPAAEAPPAPPAG
ncbi:hypothetical protein [Mycobacterium sp. 1274761.0]|uniref:DUF7159 family protein n=1 Tax=Mycobacterium sp. 1274761.0 TaxID=1834077 RepID=UPI0007FF67C1|nr:hypothetical protein [Mycobacterium sp. 1274761.0]OBK78649.1 hypothetical protein A5651_01590 [Mycobacterium sp. 1274761.0]